ncbi:MAG: NADH-quinone oxidoreductase subunit L [Chloroflexi bacterium]|nr:NADH-quinone oxidoreductase subunit L [Chloroflexota bacterium]
MERTAPDYAALVLLLPALGFLASALLGRWLPRAVVALVACGAIGVAFVAGLSVTMQMAALPAAERAQRLVLWPWIFAGDFRVSLGFLLDPLSLFMVLVVTGVGFLIHVYAVGYMHGDPGFGRFFAYMNLFVLAMLVLVLADNVLLLMVGWGGVGLCSYLLIAFWFERPEAADAGLKAFVVNAIGDVGLMLAALLLYGRIGALDYATVLSQAPQALDQRAATLVALFLLVAAVAKSAQLPLHVWLPDAMAGPTPVSALIHAATMVTAGVYLIVRLHPLFVLAPEVLALAATLGALTAFFAATLGLVQTNIKRVMAYSTVSQLGYMFLAVGLASFSAGMFHLMTHAFYKALLFLAGGAVIHALGGEEDLRKMGGLRQRLPVTYWSFLVGTIALSGVLPFSGFFSKEEILSAALAGPRANPLLGLLALATAGVTAAYIFRALLMAFHRPPDEPEHARHAHEAPPVMALPTLALVALAALGGLVQVPGVSHAVEGWLEPVFAKAHADVVPPFSPWVTALSWLVALAGLAVAWRVYAPPAKEAPRVPSGLYRLLANGYYVEALYSAVFVRPFRALARGLGERVDRGVVDATLDGIGQRLADLSRGLRWVQSGYARSYALAMLLGTVVLLWYLLWK